MQARILIAVGGLGFSAVITQLTLLRELLAAFSGNEMVLGVGLGLWLFLMGVGTGLGRTAEKLRQPVTALAVIQLLVAIVPLAQVFLLRTLRDQVFTRGAAVGLGQTATAALVLLLPYCVVAGYGLTLGTWILARERGPGGIGSVYVADSAGSIAGGLVFTFVLTRFLDHIGILLWPAALNCLSAGVLVRGDRRGGRLIRSAVLILALGLGLAAIFLPNRLDEISTGLQYPSGKVMARGNSPYGRLIVTESQGQIDFIEDGVPLTSTRDDQHVEEVVHYAMAQRPDSKRVLLIGGGICGSAREILKYGAARVDYVELDPRVLALGGRFLANNLADNRIKIFNTDGRLFVKRAADNYDVVIVDVPGPSTAQLNRFYTVEFFGEIKRALTPNGVVSVAPAEYENYVSPALACVLGSVRASLQQSFHNVLAIPGGRVFVLASDGPLTADISARIEERGIKTKLVNRHYLEATLTADRMADVANAASQEAALNKDFSPILYYYLLRHWLSQFNFRVGPLQWGLLILLAFYMARLRGGALVLFASGFAASALEFVLLFVFQVLCGSVYHQVGVIVTVFMTGLAFGAAITNWGRERGLFDLSVQAFGVAVYAALLPALLPILGRVGGMPSGLFIAKAIIGALTLTLGLLVGMQFPLANRLEFSGTAKSSARLFSADFAGAFLGALLASALLVPLIGVTGTCLVTAGLNMLAGCAPGLSWSARLPVRGFGRGR